MTIRELDLDRIDAAADCIAAFDEDMNIVLWNKVVETTYNISATEALGTSLFYFFPDIENGFMIKCFREALGEDRSFYLSKMAFTLTSGFYTQLYCLFNRDKERMYKHCSPSCYRAAIPESRFTA